MFNFLKRNCNKNKYFCIGLNKTGTTTMEQVFKDLNFTVGAQRKGELLMEDWGQKNFKRIIALSKTADAFQDMPFSLPYTFIVLDQYFVNAKFILTVRNSESDWYESLTRFQSKLWAAGDGVPPTIEQLKLATYIYKGRPFIQNQLQYDTPENEPYHKETLLNYYRSHNYNVKEYFRNRKDKLIKINVSKKSDYFKLCEFIGKTPVTNGFPWLNRSK